MKRPLARTIKIVFILLLLCFYACTLAQDIEKKAGSNTPPVNNLLTLDLKDLDLKDALKIIAQASGMNIITDKDVKARANITLKDVTWQTALDNILKTNELTYRMEGNIIRVMTLATVKKEEETLPLATKVITLNFGKCTDLQLSLNKMLSARGNIQTNVTTNSLIITDTPEILAKIEELANKLDIRTPQVMIEALIMSVKLTDSEKFGLDFTITDKDRPERKAVQALKAPSSVLDLYYGKTILPNWNITSQLNFFAEDKRVRILANPRILTLDNLAAQIEITEQVPYTYVSQSTDASTTITTTQFKDIGIRLYVTPHITKDKFISLSVKAEQSFVASFVGTTNEPSIDSRKVETNFMLRDGEAVVIGGLNKKDNTTTIDKVPILGDIPVLGRLFQKQVKEIVNTELLIFITPHIMEDNRLSIKEELGLKNAQGELAGQPSKKEKMALRNEAISDALNTISVPSVELKK